MGGRSLSAWSSYILQDLRPEYNRREEASCAGRADAPPPWPGRNGPLAFGWQARLDKRFISRQKYPFIPK